MSQWGGGSHEPSTASPRGRSDVRGDIGSASPSPATVPVPASPSLSIQVPSSPPSSLQLPLANSSFSANRAQSPPTVDTTGDNGYLTHDKLHDRCRGRGCAKKDSKAVLNSSLATMDAVERKRFCDMAAAMDASETSSGRRNRAMKAAVAASGHLSVTSMGPCCG